MENKPLRELIAEAKAEVVEEFEEGKEEEEEEEPEPQTVWTSAFLSTYWLDSLSESCNDKMVALLIYLCQCFVTVVILSLILYM